MKRLFLADILTSYVTTVQPHHKVEQVLTLMREQKISAVVVTKDKYPVGIFTERDAVRIVGRGYDPLTVEIGEVMSHPIYSVPSDMEYREAYYLIAEHGYRHLVVVDKEGKLAGIVSEGDFMRNLGMEFLLRIKEVGALMAKEVQTLSPDVKLKDAVALMDRRRLSCIVVEENDIPIGMVTERDIVRMKDTSESMLQMPLCEVMTHPVTTVRSEMPIPEAMEIMDRENFRRVVVVDEKGHTIGLLTRHDIVHQVYNRHVELLEESLKAHETKLKILTEELEKERRQHVLESRLSESQRLAHIGSWELDIVSNKFWFSDETYRIFQADPSEVTVPYEAYLNFIHPQDREMADNAYNDSILNQTPHNLVHRIQLDDGSTKYVHVRSTTYYDEEGTPLRSVGTVQDITERYEQEEEIERYHAMLMALSKESTDAIFVKDTKGCYVLGNEALARLLNKPLEEIIGADDYALFTSAVDAEHFRADDLRIQKNKTVETYEESVTVGNKILPYQTTKGPLYINGNVEGVFGIARDISSLKQAEKALKEREKHYKILFERTGTSMAIVERDGTFSLINDTAVNLLETTREALKGKHFSLFLDEEDAERVQAYYLARIRGENVPVQYEYRFKTAKGNKGTGLMTAVYLPDSEQTVISVIDISKRVMIETNYKTLFERTGTCMGIVEQDGRFSLVNETFAQLAESSREVLTGSSFLDLVHPSEKERIQAYHTCRMQGEKAPEYYAFTFRSKKGNLGTGLLYAVFLPDTQQTIVSIIDISEQKRAEEALHEQTWFLESLDAVSQVLTGEHDSVKLLDSLSALILEIFHVDRAWFLYPCDPDTTEYAVLAESTQNGFDGAYKAELKMPMDDITATLFTHALAMDRPIINQVDEQEDVPDFIREFKIQSQMAMALHPQIGDAWLMGLHQCSEKREWTDIEMRLYQAIAERIGSALSNVLLLKQLRENEKVLLEAESTAKLGHWELDIATGKAKWSDAIHRITGTDSSQEVGPAFLSSIVNQEDWPNLKTSLETAAIQGVPHEMEYRVKRPDGEERWLYCKAERQSDEDGNHAKLVGIAQDITSRKKEEQELRLSNAVFNNTSEGILITDAENNIISINPSFTDITGYTEAEVKGKNPSILQSNKQEKMFYKEMWHAMETKGMWQGEIWNRRKNGEIYPEWLSLGTVKDDKGSVLNYIGLFSDITNIKKSEEEYRFLATHDPLTKLPNRILLNEQLEYALKRMQRHGDSIAVLYLDIDRFKEINDSLGHPAGDRLLEIMAGRFREVLRAEDFVARVSGDEFVVILEEIKVASDAGRIAENILNAIKQPMTIDNHKVTVTTSIGIAMSPTDGSDSVLLLKNADSALYRAKEHGRNTYSYYSEELAAKNFELMYLHNALYNALEKEEFVVHYQPQINMKTNEVIGVEALVRWNSPEMGLVSPGRFIPVAEETGLIIPLGEWVLREACRQMRKWKMAGLCMEHMAVNLSGRQLLQENIVKIVQKVIEDTQMNPACLELEITESAVMQEEHHVGKLDALKAIGIRLSIDDFGTGYSSLSRLKRMPIDKLKIDQSFVSGIPDEEDNAKITDVIIQLSRSLNMHVIAEGVETEIQKEYLIKNGCEYAQGFLYSRPLPPDEFVLWLNARNN